MVTSVGFSNEMYLQKQSEQIAKRIAKFGGKLYLEFGGKLFDDYHASRVFPGFQPDSKVRMLAKMAEDVEIVIVVSAADIANNKVRGDIGITYDTDVLRLIDAFRGMGLYVGSVVITKYTGQMAASAFKTYLEKSGVRVFLHYMIEGYPTQISHIVSEEGFGRNEYIETSRSLVVVTAPGPGSGKMATCLSQLYHEYTRGIRAGYAKFETFPVWNLPLKHPVNLAYEAATADINDVNMIDPFHMEAYGQVAVNYNRDVEVFPVLNAIFERISGKSPYRSPSDMGVNMVGFCITDDAVVCQAAKDEILRRYFQTLCARRKGRVSDEAVQKIELLMRQLDLTVDDRPVARAAKDRSEALQARGAAHSEAVAIELPDGRIVTGKTSDLLGPASAALLNAVKTMAGIPKRTHMIDPLTIEPIQKLKTEVLGNRNPRLHSDEALLALSISAAGSEIAAQASRQLHLLRGCEAHATVMLAQVDEDVYRKLGIHLTCDPMYNSKKLFHK